MPSSQRSARRGIKLRRPITTDRQRTSRAKHAAHYRGLRVGKRGSRYSVWRPARAGEAGEPFRWRGQLRMFVRIVDGLLLDELEELLKDAAKVAPLALPPLPADLVVVL